MSTIPFKTTTHGGFAEVSGLMRYENEQLIVEFEIADAITGILKNTVKVEFPLKQIADLEYQQGFFTARIYVRTKEISVLERIPWSSGAEFAVKVRRRDRVEAKHFAEEIAWALG